MKYFLPTVITFKATLTGDVRLRFGGACSESGQSETSGSDVTMNLNDSNKLET